MAGCRLEAVCVYGRRPEHGRTTTRTTWWTSASGGNKLRRPSYMTRRGGRFEAPERSSELYDIKVRATLGPETMDDKVEGFLFSTSRSGRGGHDRLPGRGTANEDRHTRAVSPGWLQRRRRVCFFWQRKRRRMEKRRLWNVTRPRNIEGLPRRSTTSRWISFTSCSAHPCS